MMLSIASPAVSPPARLPKTVILSAILLAVADGPARALEGAAQRAVELPSIVATSEADSGVTETTRSYTTDAMSTATGLSLSIRDTPQSVSVVTRQMMDHRGMQTTIDALQAAPGITIERRDSNRHSVSARGFTIDNYQIDGMTYPLLIPWTFGETNLDLVVFDRVEVVRGATGLMTGAGNPSAAINYMRKRPLRECSASAGLGIGRWDLRRGFADISTPITKDGRIRGRIIGAYSKSNSYTNLQNTTTRTLYGVISADLAPGTELTGGVSYQSSDFKGFGSASPLFYSDGTPTDFSRSVSNNAKWARVFNNTTTGFLDLSHQFANDWKLRLAYTQSYTDPALKYIYRYGFPDRQTGLGMGHHFTNYQGNLRRQIVNVSLSGPFAFFGREHEFSLGWMWSRDRLTMLEYAPLSPDLAAGSFYDPGATPQPNWSSEPVPGDKLYNRQSGAYAVGRFSLTDQLRLIIGGRISHWETDQNYFGRERHYRHRNEFVPYAGLLFDLNDVYTAYASYTEIFKPQNNRDESGKILPPITGKSYELGLKAAWLGGRLNGAVSLFQTRQDNLAQAAGKNVMGAPPNTQAYRAVPGAKVQGVELEASGELLPGWSLAGSFTRYIAKDAQGQPVNTDKPRSTFKLYTTYRLPGKLNRLTLGGGIDWQSRIYNDAKAPGNRKVQFRQGSYALVNVMARYVFNDRLSATLNVNNLFDKKYYSQIVFHNQAWYGEPRNVMLSLQATY